MLDTCVASLLLRRDALLSPLYVAHLSNATASLSFQTVAELRFGALNANWGEARRQGLEDFIRRFVVVPSSSSVTNHCATVRLNAKRSGRPISVQDAWIAACALDIGATLLTHDGDFQAANCPNLVLVRYDAQGIRVQI